MTEDVGKLEEASVDEIYGDYWHVNTGNETIHAKRMGGRFRTLKWLTHSVWLFFFLGPYLRWHGRQAVLLDIPARKFHFFDITILPQDVWMLSLVLLFFAILLAVVTSLAGRVFCGYFCFQTAWTDVFTWIEDKLEGSPQKRRKLDQAPLGTRLVKRVPKYAAWLVISLLTGVSFAAWFTDAHQLWHDYLTLQAPMAAWTVLGLFTVGTFVLAGFMREQVCFWLCPYARIQSVMYDKETILPTYDYNRGEPRGKLKKGKLEQGKGDCIDCNQCVAACPTGVDIRSGQHEGCITCALCIDACDAVMDKIDRPRGLIRYASLDEIEGLPTKKLYQRPRVLVYFGIISLAAAGIFYGLTHLGTLGLSVLHERQVMFVPLSDGSIQNSYTVKILNKTDKDLHVHLKAIGPVGVTINDSDKPLLARQGRVTEYDIFAKVPRSSIKEERMPLTFRVTADDMPTAQAEYKSMFFGPAP